LKTFGTGTVGCVVLDSKGKIAVATSTGGKGFEIQDASQIQLL
jgi:L-asparaginase